MKCNHQRNYWHTVVDVDWETGERVSQSEPVIEETFRDIDIHRYKCTQCDKVFYYSSAAKDFYEKGIRRGVFA